MMVDNYKSLLEVLVNNKISYTMYIYKYININVINLVVV